MRKSDQSLTLPDRFQEDLLAGLSREVYGILGIPIDAIELSEVIRKIEEAAAQSKRFFLSTPNVNFIVSSRDAPNFRASLLSSDLCPPDGMPVVWIGRLLGVPLSDRIAGADIFEALRIRTSSIRAFLFGGPEGVAAAAADRLNSTSSGLRCVGTLYPGYGTLDEMSTDEILGLMNASGADFLAVALGAPKGQAWLLHNRERLRIPVRVHLGATIAFQAGTMKRAPKILQRWGLEWLWRIKEEPNLRHRYIRDGRCLLTLFCFNVLPLVILNWISNHSWGKSKDFSVVTDFSGQAITIQCAGPATQSNVPEFITRVKWLMTAGKSVHFDFASASHIDCRFIGVLLVLRNILEEQGLGMKIARVSPPVERILRLNQFEYLLSS